MKISALNVCLFAGLATAAPTPSTVSGIIKRASLNDTPYGYANLNGGTTGGAGGTTTTVSTYAQFTKAVSGNANKVVILSGPISTSEAQVDVGSNTSIIGKGSNAKLTGVGL